VQLSLQSMLLPTSRSYATPALTYRQSQVVRALAKGANITAAAAAAGLNRCTVHRWLGTEQFQEAVRQARAAATLAARDEAKRPV
jgi:DNA-binding NarL/FixJ family response regulator